MKKLQFSVLGIILLACLVSCGNLRSQRAAVPEGKTLVAYFSLEGNSLFDGDSSDPDAVTSASVQRSGNSFPPQVINGVHKGNTQIIAEYIADKTSGDLFEIRVAPEERYPLDGYQVLDIARDELVSAERPVLISRIEDMASYDVVYLGYPIWNGTMPMALFSFLEEYDFSGKTIIPFCTHDGSRAGRSVRDIEAECPGANVLEAFPVRYSAVQGARAEVEEWIDSLNQEIGE